MSGVLITLLGGPMDGHQLETKLDKQEIIPGPHHRRDAECLHIPIYVKVDYRTYRFDRYLVDSI